MDCTTKEVPFCGIIPAQLLQLEVGKEYFNEQSKESRENFDLQLKELDIIWRGEQL